MSRGTRLPYAGYFSSRKYSRSFSGIEDGQYVIVREPGGHFDLAQKPVRSDFCRDLGTQNFYGDCALVTQVASEIDDGHSAFAELSVHDVAAGEPKLETPLEVIHVDWPILEFFPDSL